MGLQCRSTVTWTGGVAVAALEDGHVLPTSMRATSLSSALVHGDLSKRQIGRVDEPQMVLAATLRYSQPTGYDTATSAVKLSDISMDLWLHSSLSLI